LQRIIELSKSGGISTTKGKGSQKWIIKSLSLWHRLMPISYVPDEHIRIQVDGPQEVNMERSVFIQKFDGCLYSPDFFCFGRI